MKKLQRLKINKLQGFTCIGAEEQMMMKGGYTQSQMESMMNNGTWTGGQVDGMGYVGSGTTVYGDYPIGTQSECPRCQQWHTVHNQYSQSGGFGFTPIGEYIFNTLPHKMGWGDHQ